MRRVLLPFAILSPLALAACSSSVPDSGQGVGFQDYNSYNAQREASLTNGTPMVPQGAQPIMGGGVTSGAIGTPTTGFSTDRIGAVLDQAAGTGAPLAPTMAPMSPAMGGQGAVIGSNMGAPMGTVAAATPMAPAAAPMQPVAPVAQPPVPQPPVPPAQLPARAGDKANVVQYALATNHAVGTPMYERSSLQLRSPEKACASYASPDQAQAAFLDAGGPDKDRKGLDPDGDGFACSWDPTPFRNAVK